MKLKPIERDYYVLEITADPVLGGTWQASFDRGVTWVDGVLGEGKWSWLVAGPDFAAIAVAAGLDPDDTAATITDDVTPQLRNADNPVLDVEDGPRIYLMR